MSGKISWSGLCLMLVAPVFSLPNIFVLVGAIIMAVGVILMWINK